MAVMATVTISPKGHPSIFLVPLPYPFNGRPLPLPRQVIVYPRLVLATYIITLTCNGYPSRLLFSPTHSQLLFASGLHLPPMLTLSAAAPLPLLLMVSWIATCTFNDYFLPMPLPPAIDACSRPHL